MSLGNCRFNFTFWFEAPGLVNLPPKYQKCHLKLQKHMGNLERHATRHATRHAIQWSFSFEDRPGPPTRWPIAAASLVQEEGHDCHDCHDSWTGFIYFSSLYWKLFCDVSNSSQSRRQQVMVTKMWQIHTDIVWYSNSFESSGFSGILRPNLRFSKVSSISCQSHYLCRKDSERAPECHAKAPKAPPKNMNR